MPDHVPNHHAGLMNPRAAEQYRVGLYLCYHIPLFCQTVPFAAWQLLSLLSAVQVLNLGPPGAQHRKHQHSRNLAKRTDQASSSFAAAAPAAAAAAVAQSPVEAAQEALKSLMQADQN